MGLRAMLNRAAPHFEKGGKYQRLYPLYEMLDTILYMPATTSQTSPHIRDGIDMKRIMITVWLATFPAMFFGMWNLGLQANTFIQESGGIQALQTDWRHWCIALMAGNDPASLWDNLVYGFWHFMPIYAVAFIVGGLWEVLFATVRGHEINEGFFVTSVLFALSCPPDLPLIYVAMGISFGVVIGKEVFGGTGKNFVNPALTGRAFLYFAYPASMSGDTAWVAVDGYSGATALSLAASGGLESVQAQLSFVDALVGTMPGSIGETSTLAIAAGGLVLLLMGIASWRIVLGCIIGTAALGGLFNLVSADNPLFALPWHWHFVLGGWAFGVFFMATDPVSAAMTNTGRLIYGILIGMMTVLIRVVNPAFPEGVMLAILFCNLLAPTIDHFVVQRHIARRQRRLA